MPGGHNRCSTLLYLLFMSEALSSLEGSNTPIIGLLLLIGKINEDDATSGLCAFGVLHFQTTRGPLKIYLYPTPLQKRINTNLMSKL